MKYYSKIMILLSIMALVSGCGKKDRGVSEESKNPGFQFEKVMETSDSSETFYFKYPDNDYYGGLILADIRGDIYVRDDGRILKFSGSGEFIKGLVEGGQGPGEVTKLKEFFLLDKKLFIYNSLPSKIILKNTDGSLIEELRLGDNPFRKFIAFHDGFYYFSDNETPEIKGGEAKIIDVYHYLLEVSLKGEVKKIENISFPLKTYAALVGGLSGMLDICEFIVTPTNNGEYFFISHTSEYSIKLWDAAKKALVKTLSRPYERQEPPAEIVKKINRRGFRIEDKVYRPPAPKYLDDIRQLLLYRDKLWVVTSTVDTEKGMLIDVFSSSGDYIRSFYLKLSDRVKYFDYFTLKIFVSGDFLYCFERDGEDNPWLVKYRITGK